MPWWRIKISAALLAKTGFFDKHISYKSVRDVLWALYAIVTTSGSLSRTNRLPFTLNDPKHETIGALGSIISIGGIKSPEAVFTMLSPQKKIALWAKIVYEAGCFENRPSLKSIYEILSALYRLPAMRPFLTFSSGVHESMVPARLSSSYSVGYSMSVAPALHLVTSAAVPTLSSLSTMTCHSK